MTSKDDGLAPEAPKEELFIPPPHGGAWKDGKLIQVTQPPRAKE